VTFALCFVCTGNICRSPMAEVVLRHLATARTVDGGSLADRIAVTSAGTGPWHEGEAMDPRARSALAHRGYHDHGHVAHQLDKDQLGRLDLVVALDRTHLVPGPPAVLLRSFDPTAPEALDVPDPYYGDERGFAACLEIIERGCEGLAEWLAARLEPPDR
jgi:low molecular weight protein-tyrosine phosphatase